MKIGVFLISGLTLGKHNIKDSRLDEVAKITGSKKKTYLQAELVAEDSLLDSDAIVALKDSRTDLVLKDLEFVETRLSRAEGEGEKLLLGKLKNILEKEEFVSALSFTEEEKKLVSGYGLLTNKPVVCAGQEELEDLSAFLARALAEAGYISFFTSGEKETRAWLIKQGATAWEAAGAIHSDIQRGFIRAEIIAFDDFISAGGETAAKQAGKLRAEHRDYMMQDADLANFKFSK